MKDSAKQADADLWGLCGAQLIFGAAIAEVNAIELLPRTLNLHCFRALFSSGLALQVLRYRFHGFRLISDDAVARGDS